MSFCIMLHLQLVQLFHEPPFGLIVLYCVISVMQDTTTTEAGAMHASTEWKPCIHAAHTVSGAGGAKLHSAFRTHFFTYAAPSLQLKGFACRPRDADQPPGKEGEKKAASNLNETACFTFTTCDFAHLLKCCCMQDVPC